MCDGECGSRCPLQNFDKIVKMMGGGDEIPGNEALRNAGIQACKNCMGQVKTQVEKLTPKK